MTNQKKIQFPGGQDKENGAAAVRETVSRECAPASIKPPVKKGTKIRRKGGK